MKASIILLSSSISLAFQHYCPSIYCHVPLGPGGGALLLYIR